MFNIKTITRFLLNFLSASQRDFLFGIKRLNVKKREHPDVQLFIIIFDGLFFHGGLTDRFKGIISTFHYCLYNNINFRIKHIYPFDITEYLVPNKYNWKICHADKISYHLFETKFVNLIGDMSIKRLVNLSKKKQIHCYANRNIIDSLSTFYNTNFDWGTLFKMLFKPSEKLEKMIQKQKSQIKGEYICAVFRFQQLLGDFNEYNYTELDNTEKTILIDKCKKSIIKLQDASDCKNILITSDSITFLQNVSEMNSIYTFPAKVVHIDTTEGETHDVYMKSFLDFYMLSEGKKIYSIGTDIMYKTEFPLYASKLNNIPFERILIE